ncbi:hypothetical protein AVEN_198479-1 [Araneus ventricosus]|uniref:C2H2-type domain-containing protein n=1 Tax=Araneus ventricosus TaxID=182803 RepID=A0A4Y2MVV7_ARAVE|nr:hypothetical protein AVEN_198479-1 [Araneus ventricosus]
MAYSAEESSPVEYFESCCICDEEFSSDSELTNHLLEHANDEEFKSSLKRFELKNSIPERRKSGSFVGQPIKRSFSQRSKSPEVVELLSDESDDESSKNKKQAAPPVASNQVKAAATTNVAKPTQNTQNPVQTNPNPKAAQLGIYNCTQCSMVFKDLKLYKEHLSTHDKARPYACQICNKKFAYKGTLRQHLHLHIGEKSHECKVCHKKFSLKRMLRQHEETHELEQRQGLVISKV